MRLQRAESPALLNGHEAASRFFAACFATGGPSQERLWVAHVDHSAQCLHLASYEGGQHSVAMPVRAIVADAMRLGSAGVVLAHNHPSGESQPSRADCLSTRRFAQLGEAIDLTVLDHLIFAAGGCSSMRRMGLL